MMYYAILILGLLILAIASYKKIDLALGIVILALPFYLIRLEIFSIPTTVLELMIYAVFGVWMIKKVKSQKSKVKSQIGKIFRAHKDDAIINESKVTPFCLQNKKFQILKSNFLFPIFLILLGCVISIIVSPNKQVGLGILKGWFIDPLLLFLIISDVVKMHPLTPSKLEGEITSPVPILKGRKKEGVIKILSFLAVSGIIAAVAGLFYYFFKELTYDGRLKAFFLSPNHLAMYLAPAGIICFGLFLFSLCHSRAPLQRYSNCGQESGNPEFKKNRFRIKYFWLFGFIICSIAIFLTYSYGAWIGFGTGILFLIFFSFDAVASRKKFLLLVIAVLFLSILFFSQRNTEKFQNFANFSRSSFESRIMIWKVSSAILKDHPFLGIGPGNFQNFYLDYQKKFPPYLEWAVPQPHNLFLAFYLQCGLLGLIGFLWLIFLFFKKGFQAIASNQQSIILLAVMVYILIHGLIDAPYWKNDLSIIFWIVVGLMKAIQDLELNSNIQ
jgi:O-antigen ligase